MNAIGGYDSGSDDEPAVKRQCIAPLASAPKAPPPKAGKPPAKAGQVGIASPAGKPPAPKASGPPVTQDIKPLEQAKKCKDMGSAGDVLSFIQSNGMTILKHGAASCHVLAEIANRLDEGNRPHWAGTSEVKSLVMAVKNALWKDMEMEKLKNPMKPATLADGLFGLMYLLGLGKDESTRNLLKWAAGKWAAELQQNQSMPGWPVEALVRAAWCLSQMNFVHVKLERNSRELAKDLPMIKSLLEIWVARVSSTSSGDLIAALGTMVKLPDMVRLDKGMQRDVVAKVVMGIQHMEPWHLLAVAAAMSKLETKEYGVNSDGPMQAIRKRLPSLREVMPEANHKWLEQVLAKSAELAEIKHEKEDFDASKQKRWNKEEAEEYRKTRHWTAKNAGYMDYGKAKVTPYLSRFR